MASPIGNRRREQKCELCSEAIPGGNLKRHQKNKHPEAERTIEHKNTHNGEARLPKCVSGWLDLCDVDLSPSRVRCPLDKLDQLPDLRIEPNKTHG
jgi:hypothetical protein